ncbi:MAG: AbrB/MazE/SpoVT family DNA-binding domain-containing protein [Gemmatimonadaceae bacterium]
MLTRVQKWGNSLGLRIPKPVAEQIHIVEGSAVELEIREDTLCITPVSPRRYSLDELLAGVNAENIHGDVDTGPAVGAEVW